MTDHMERFGRGMNIAVMFFLLALALAAILMVYEWIVTQPKAVVEMLSHAGIAVTTIAAIYIAGVVSERYSLDKWMPPFWGEFDE